MGECLAAFDVNHGEVGIQRSSCRTSRTRPLFPRHFQLSSCFHPSGVSTSTMSTAAKHGLVPGRTQSAQFALKMAMVPVWSLFLACCLGTVVGGMIALLVRRQSKRRSVQFWHMAGVQNSRSQGLYLVGTVGIEKLISHLRQEAGPVLTDAIHNLSASIVLAWRQHNYILISAKRTKKQSESYASTALASSENESGALGEPALHGPPETRREDNENTIGNDMN